MIDVSLIIALLVAITLLAALATKIGTPYPVVLVLGGLAMGLMPGLPTPLLDPDLVLVLFLPFLLYSSAALSSVEDLRANAGPILLLAIGLVLATVAGVAVIAALVVGLPWAVAFVLGAVVGPTDPVSASAILGRLGAPDRLVTILEGESLVNDGTAITAYVIAVAAVQTGHFSPLDAVWKFVFEVAVGTAIGLVAAWLGGRARRLFADVGVQLALTLLMPFAAYIAADSLGASGVLAAVAAGLYSATRETQVTSADTRLQLRAFWRLLVFLLNALLFLLIGLQLPHVMNGIGGLSWHVVWHALAIAAAVLAIRLAWMFLVSPVATALGRGRGATPARPGTRLVLGWGGMRGAVSLAIALAIPLSVDGGGDFPHRSLVVFLAYATVLLTLVPPGLTLEPLIRRLGLQRGAQRQRRLNEARARVLHAALEEIESLAASETIGGEAALRLRGPYEARLERLTERLEAEGPPADGPDPDVRLRRAVIDAQRERLAELAGEPGYSAEMLREIEYDLDIQEARLR